MANKKAGDKMSMSRHIKAYLAKKPNAGPKEVVEALAQNGISVKTGLVSNIKYALGKKKTVRRKVPTRTSKGNLSAVDLIAAKRFVDSIGGVGNAKQAIDMLEDLR